MWRTSGATSRSPGRRSAETQRRGRQRSRYRRNESLNLPRGLVRSSRNGVGKGSTRSVTIQSAETSERRRRTDGAVGRKSRLEDRPCVRTLPFPTVRSSSPARVRLGGGSLRDEGSRPERRRESAPSSPTRDEATTPRAAPGAALSPISKPAGRSETRPAAPSTTTFARIDPGPVQLHGNFRRGRPYHGMWAVSLDRLADPTKRAPFFSTHSLRRPAAAT